MSAEEIINEAFDEQGNLKPEYQGMLQDFDLSDAPREVQDLANGERSNVVVQLDNGEQVTIGVAVEDGRITELNRGGFEQPTSEIHTNEETIREIAASENPAAKFTEKFGSGEIRYESKSSETFLKGLLINLGAFFAWLLSNPILLIIIIVAAVILLLGAIVVLLSVFGVVVVKGGKKQQPKEDLEESQQQEEITNSG